MTERVKLWHFSKGINAVVWTEKGLKNSIYKDNLEYD